MSRYAHHHRSLSPNVHRAARRSTHLPRLRRPPRDAIPSLPLPPNAGRRDRFPSVSRRQHKEPASHRNGRPAGAGESRPLAAHSANAEVARQAKSRAPAGVIRRRMPRRPTPALPSSGTSRPRRRLPCCAREARPGDPLRRTGRRQRRDDLAIRAEHVSRRLEHDACADSEAGPVLVASASGRY